MWQFYLSQTQDLELNILKTSLSLKTWIAFKQNIIFDKLTIFADVRQIYLSDKTYLSHLISFVWWFLIKITPCSTTGTEWEAISKTFYKTLLFTCLCFYTAKLPPASVTQNIFLETFTLSLLSWTIVNISITILIKFHCN